MSLRKCVTSSRITLCALAGLRRRIDLSTVIRSLNLCLSVLVCAAHMAVVWLVIAVLGGERILVFILSVPVFFGTSVLFLNLLLERECERMLRDEKLVGSRSRSQK